MQGEAWLEDGGGRGSPAEVRRARQKAGDAGSHTALFCPVRAAASLPACPWRSETVGLGVVKACPGPAGGQAAPGPCPAGTLPRGHSGVWDQVLLRVTLCFVWT